MPIVIDQYKDTLIKYNIRPTYQRIKILEFLDHNLIHPTIDEIYNSLYPEIPTLSKTTVYNTLKSFTEKNLVKELNVDNTEVRYDIKTGFHGHFLCKKCNKVYDFEFDTDEDLPVPNGIDDFNVETKNVIYLGTCKDCQED